MCASSLFGIGVVCHLKSHTVTLLWKFYSLPPSPMKKRRWSCSGSLPILHIDESESKVDIYLNKQFTYPSLFFLCLHNSIFFAPLLRFSPQNLNILSTKPAPPNFYCSPSPSLLLLLLLLPLLLLLLLLFLLPLFLLPPPSGLHRLLPFPFFWRSVIGGCPQAREGPATVVN